MSCDFFDLIERLAGAGVDFVIVGGFAGVAHGCTYVTQDIDICCDFSASNLLRLQQAISDLHPVHRMAAARPRLKLDAESCGPFKNLYLDTDIGQLDCVSFVAGVGDYQKTKAASEIIEVKQIKVRVLSVDALIKSKQAMNRPRDKEGLLQLEAIKKLRKKEL